MVRFQLKRSPYTPIDLSEIRGLGAIKVWIVWLNLILLAAMPAYIVHHHMNDPAPLVATSLSPSEVLWYSENKSQCNVLEVELLMSHDSPPSTPAGVGYGAACYAIAGKIDKTRNWLNQLEADELHIAVNIVFSIGHPIADAGDDRSASPIMKLVADYQPYNFMAVYHAGLSEYQLGNHAAAKPYLEHFLKIYTGPDHWTETAQSALDDIKSGRGIDAAH